MNEADALELLRTALWTVIVGSAPAVIAAMVVGIAIALVQALTQIQETTLTFVPKLVVVFLVLLISGSFIGGQVFAFSEQIYARIEHGF